LSNLARQYQQPKHIDYKPEQKRQVQPKKKMTPFTQGEKGIILLLFLITLVVVAYIVSNYATAYSMNREIHILQGNIGQQVKVNDALSLQVIELSAPNRILHIASEKLGMTLDDNKVKVIQN
jgi:cell division protein FtsL